MGVYLFGMMNDECLMKKSLLPANTSPLCLRLCNLLYELNAMNKIEKKIPLLPATLPPLNSSVKQLMEWIFELKVYLACYATSPLCLFSVIFSYCAYSNQSSQVLPLSFQQQLPIPIHHLISSDETSILALVSCDEIWFSALRADLINTSLTTSASSCSAVLLPPHDTIFTGSPFTSECSPYCYCMEQDRLPSPLIGYNPTTQTIPTKVQREAWREIATKCQLNDYYNLNSQQTTTES